MDNKNRSRTFKYGILIRNTVYAPYLGSILRIFLDSTTLPSRHLPSHPFSGDSFQVVLVVADWSVTVGKRLSQKPQSQRSVRLCEARGQQSLLTTPLSERRRRRRKRRKRIGRRLWPSRPTRRGCAVGGPCLQTTRRHWSSSSCRLHSDRPLRCLDVSMSTLHQWQMSLTRRLSPMLTAGPLSIYVRSCKAFCQWRHGQQNAGLVGLASADSVRGAQRALQLCRTSRFPPNTKHRTRKYLKRQTHCISLDCTVFRPSNPRLKIFLGLFSRLMFKKQREYGAWQIKQEVFLFCSI